MEKKKTVDFSESTVNQLTSAAINFRVFCVHRHFRGNYFSRTEELDYARAMYIIFIWTFIFANSSFSRISQK